MKISDLGRVDRLNSERREIESRLHKLRKFAEVAKAEKAASASSKKHSDDEDEEVPEYSQPLIEISARYKNHPSRDTPLRCVFDEKWLEAVAAVLQQDVDKIEAEMRELGVTL